MYSTECLDPRDITIITSGWTNDKEKRATKYIMHIAHELEDHSTFLYTHIYWLSMCMYISMIYYKYCMYDKILFQRRGKCNRCLIFFSFQNITMG